MSVQSEIERISSNVADTYSALSDLGATMPEEQNSDNLAATARTVTGGGDVSVQADWGQNNEAAANYVKNRTHYEELLSAANSFAWDGVTDGKETVTAADGTLYCKVSDTVLPSLAALVGAAVVENVGGTESETQVTGETITDRADESIQAGYVTGANGLTVYVVLADFTTDDLSLTAGIHFSYTVDDTGAVTGYVKSLATVDTYTVTPLAEKFIPDTIQRTLTFDTTPKSGSTNPVTSSGLYFEFNSISENLGTAVWLSLPGSLKWDGVVGDREHIVLAQSDDSIQSLVLISDKVPDMSAPACSLSFNGFVQNQAVSQVELYNLADGIYGMSSLPYIFIVEQDNAICDGITFPKKGVYLYCHQLVSGALFIPYIYIGAVRFFTQSFGESSGVDEYFETVKVMAETGSDTLTWDGDTTGLPCWVADDGIGYYKVSDSVPTEADLANGATTIDSGGSSSSVTFNHLYNDGFLTSETVLIVPYDNYIYVGDVVFSEAGIYFLKINAGYVKSLTVPGYNFSAMVETKTAIKTEYLPETPETKPVFWFVNLGDTSDTGLYKDTVYETLVPYDEFVSAVASGRSPCVVYHNYFERTYFYSGQFYFGYGNGYVLLGDTKFYCAARTTTETTEVTTDE